MSALLKTVEVFGDGWRAAFEIGKRPDGTFMVVNVTDEDRLTARIFSGRMMPWEPSTCFQIHNEALAAKVVEGVNLAIETMDGVR